MRILATGDNHFCEDKRWEECCRVHDWVAEQAHEHKPDVFLFSGDMFERKSTPLERLAVANLLLKILDVCPVVVARGNHDEDLELFTKIRGSHQLFIVQDARVIPFLGADGRCLAVAAMAWPNVATLRASGMDERTALQSVLRGLGSEVAAHDGPSVAVGHWMIDGSETGHGQPLIGHTLNVSLTELTMLNCPLVLAGHIHKPQEWQSDGTEIRYCGSPFRTAYGETEQKSIVMADWDGKRWTTTLLPTPARQMLLYEDEWGEFDGRDTWLVGDGSELEANGAEVRFRYRVESDKRDAAADKAAEFKMQLLAHGAYAVKIEERVIAKTRARTPEIAATQSTQSQLETLWRARGEDVDPMRKARLFEKVDDVEKEVA